MCFSKKKEELITGSHKASHLLSRCFPHLLYGLSIRKLEEDSIDYDCALITALVR